MESTIVKRDETDELRATSVDEFLLGGAGKMVQSGVKIESLSGKGQRHKLALRLDGVWIVGDGKRGIDVADDSYHSDMPENDRYSVALMDGGGLLVYWTDAKNRTGSGQIHGLYGDVTEMLDDTSVPHGLVVETMTALSWRLRKAEWVRGRNGWSWYRSRDLASADRKKNLHCKQVSPVVPGTH